MGGNLLLSMLLMLQTNDIVVRTSEPRPASPWQETFSARCGSQRLEVRRPMRPLQSSPEVLLNGRTPRGDLRPLEQELSRVGAAYRMSFTCSQFDAMQLTWVSGHTGPDGHVRYRAGSAIFQDGSLIQSGAEEATAETFWYR